MVVRNYSRQTIQLDGRLLIHKVKPVIVDFNIVNGGSYG
jgi:hypothetical protein